MELDIDEFTLARDLARDAHAGQTRNDGVTSVFAGHLAPMAAHACQLGLGAQVETLCYLHDVVEDTELTLDDLRAHGFSDLTVECVDALTQRKDQNEPYASYLSRIATAHPFAVQTKLIDLMHNWSCMVQDGVYPSCEENKQRGDKFAVAIMLLAQRLRTAGIEPASPPPSLLPYLPA
tara:strand:+ start:1001 stop:1534 length:534 start_codon:yes stop_codon:yes gene_type:complete